MPVEDNDLAVTYSLIYSFLTERSHFKAAEAVRKAAKDVITMKSYGKDGPSLPVIVKQWKKFAADQGKKTMSPTKLTRSESSSSDTGSDSSETSESTSEGTSSESDIDSETNSRPLESNTRSKARVIPYARSKVDAESKAKPPASESSQLSSELDRELGVSNGDRVKNIMSGTKAKGATVAVSLKLKSGNSPNTESDSSESSPGEESDSESEEDAPTPKAVAMEAEGTNPSSVSESRSPTRSSHTLPSIKSSDDSDSDSESSQSSTSAGNSSSASDPDNDPDSNSVSDVGKKSVQVNDKSQKTKAVNAPSTSAIRFPQESDGSTAVSKRQRTDEAGSSIPTSIIRQPKASNPHQKGNGEGKPRKANTPFSRIKVDEIRFEDERLKDNTFESRKAAANDYGVKASADLVMTRGAGFRKEKSKKKRGIYRGGEITMESHSIKFTD